MPDGGTEPSSLPPHDHPQDFGNSDSSLQELNYYTQETASTFGAYKRVSTLTECDDNSKSEETNGTCGQKSLLSEEKCVVEEGSSESASVGERDSELSSEGESNSAESAIEKKSGSMVRNYLLSPAYIAFGIFLVLFFAHPKWINLLASSEGVAEQMTYTQNFYLWTRYNPDKADKIIIGLPKKLEETHFYSRRTFVIIHGFLGSGMDEWIIRMKDAFLKREDCNVVSVDWAAGEYTAGYYVIQARVLDVGKDVGKLLQFLEEETAITPAMIHVIGHSLGAHISGFAGKSLNGTLARITGLDPAGLMYHSTNETQRLDKSDAHFVDVIHTHGCTVILNQWSDCYGIDENIGDADFWPNGGERQPACVEGSGGDGAELIKEGASCDHGMAYVYYTESLQYDRSTTHFLARPCAAYVFYNACACGDTPQYMGYNVNPGASGVFYLNTTISAPYALQDPSCPPGAFSTVQLIGLFVLVGVAVASILVGILVVVEKQFNVVVCLGLRSVVHWATRRRGSQMGSSNLIHNNQGEVGEVFT